MSAIDDKKKKKKINGKQWWIVYLLFACIEDGTTCSYPQYIIFITSRRIFILLLLHISPHFGNVDCSLRKTNTNTIFIEFLWFICFLTGKSGWAAPRLKDAGLSLDKLREGYVEVSQITTVYISPLMLAWFSSENPLAGVLNIMLCGCYNITFLFRSSEAYYDN